MLRLFYVHTERYSMSTSDAPTGYRSTAVDGRVAVASQPIWRCETRGCGYWIPRADGDEVPTCPYCVTDWIRQHKKSGRPVHDRLSEAVVDGDGYTLKPVYGVRMWEAVRAEP